MVGSTVQQTCRIEEAKAVRAVENREDGTRTSSGSAGSEAKAAMPMREWTLRLQTTEGRSLEIPGEAFNTRPRAAVGGGDGDVEIGDVEAQEGTGQHSKE
jgi:hypothetical protein